MRASAVVREGVQRTDLGDLTLLDLLQHLVQVKKEASSGVEAVVMPGKTVSAVTDSAAIGRTSYSSALEKSSR